MSLQDKRQVGNTKANKAKKEKVSIRYSCLAIKQCLLGITEAAHRHRLWLFLPFFLHLYLRFCQLPVLLLEHQLRTGYTSTSSSSSSTLANWAVASKVEEIGWFCKACENSIRKKWYITLGKFYKTCSGRYCLSDKESDGRRAQWSSLQVIWGLD